MNAPTTTLSALDAAVAQFKRKVDMGLVEVEVPEWPQPDGTPTKLFFGAENSEQRDEYYGLLRENKFEGFLQFLIVRARTEDGKRAFVPKDALTLRKRADPGVIVQIVQRANEKLDEAFDAVTALKGKDETEVDALKKS